MMDQKDLKQALIMQPELIEKGLVFKENKVNIRGNSCDLLFIDKNGTELYVEVKLRVRDNAYGQLARYDAIVNNPMARFMLVGLSFQDGLKDALARNGYEFCELNEESIVCLIERLNIILDLEMDRRQEKIRNHEVAE